MSTSPVEGSAAPAGPDPRRPSSPGIAGLGASGLRLFATWNRRFPSAGVLALAALVIGVVSGVALAIGYDVREPRTSLALLALSSPAGRILRALHTWSGNLLLVLGLLHLVEHLAKRSDRGIASGLWLRAVLAAPLILAVLFGGFLLRGDAEGVLARQIMSGLLDELPVIGPAMAAGLLGVRVDLELVYVHHAATFTVLLVFLAVEHGRRLWPSAGAFLGVLAASILLAVPFPPGLHDGLDAARRGPWYFLTVQELLHWLERPAWAWPLLLAPFVAIAALRWAPDPWRARLHAALAAGLGLYTLVLVFAASFRGAGWELRFSLDASSPAPLPLFARLDPVAVRTGRGGVEGCLGCHRDVTGIEPAHDPASIGCFACHLGDPTSAGADSAHRGMVEVPGNLSTAEATCGQAGCHGDLVHRVRGSLMARVPGMIAVDRWAFGERPTPDGTEGPESLGASPADRHLRQLCTSCHLGEERTKAGPRTELTRGGGCAACHVEYPAEPAPAHPRLTVQVRDEACFGCHSRSGRISLGYAGLRESSLDRAEAEAQSPGAWRALEDGRVVLTGEPDVHHAAKLACVDCHTAKEVMGDGASHAHQEQATRIRCETCHRTSPARAAAPDAEASAILRLRGRAEAPPLLAEDRTGEPLTNARIVPGTGDLEVEIERKLTKETTRAKPPAPECSEIAGHARLSCQSCHSAWAHVCAGCHTQFTGGVESGGLSSFGFAALRAIGSQGDGQFVEYAGPPAFEPPALGLLSRHGEISIEPAVPGMVMTLNGPDTNPPSPLPARASELIDDETRLVRAFAPSVPHTTTAKGRSCASCHDNPAALGWGRGTVTRDGSAPSGWRFEPAFEAMRDGLPADAWIAPFAGEGAATRRELAPLEPDTQRRVLEVGRCLKCHDADVPRNRAMYRSYPPAARPGCPG